MFVCMPLFTRPSIAPRYCCSIRMYALISGAISVDGKCSLSAVGSVEMSQYFFGTSLLYLRSTSFQWLTSCIVFQCRVISASLSGCSLRSFMLSANTGISICLTDFSVIVYIRSLRQRHPCNNFSVRVYLPEITVIRVVIDGQNC